MSAFIVTCVHGTWARGSTWPALEQSVIEALGDAGPVEFRYFQWSGRNSVRSRARAAARLRDRLRDDMACAPHARQVLVAHSHGANILLHALAGADPLVREHIAGIALLSPPLLDCQLIDDVEAAANRLLIGAFMAVPLLPLAIGFARKSLGWSPTMTLLTLGAMLVVWLAMFRPARIRRRADALVRQLALPRLDFPTRRPCAR